MKRILFILKRNETYGFKNPCRRSAGLWNSTNFIVASLKERGIHAHIVEVHDNNDIDREVYHFKPNKVVIEALWVVPKKFDVLKRLHPQVEWYVHMHSGIPFLGHEGIATEWLIEYVRRGIGIIANSVSSYKAFLAFLCDEEVEFLPNMYVPDGHFHRISDKQDWDTAIDICCLGAIRPMKNQLIQAMAAYRFACEVGRPLRFHINATRVETGGEPILKNIRMLFAKLPGAELIEEDWHEHEVLMYKLRHEMDIGMQVSLTETFNVVCADYVTAGLPFVCSDQVRWASSFNKAECDDVEDIVEKMHFVYGSRLLSWWNRKLLGRHIKRSAEMWYQFAIS